MRRIALSATLLICLIVAAAAGAAKLDQGFGKGGVVITEFGTRTDVRGRIATQIVVEASGRIVLGIGGPRGTYTVERLTPDGALDPSFGDGGVVTSSISGLAMAVAPDGGIVVAGSSGGGTPGRDIAVTRYEPDGKVDRRFGRGGIYRLDAGLEDEAEAVALQPDGRIVVAGRSGRRSEGPGYHPSPKLVLLRLSPDGRLRSRTDRAISGAEVGLAVAADGRILVATETQSRYWPAQVIAFTGTGKVRDGVGKQGAVELVGHPDPLTFTLGADGDPLYTGAATDGAATVRRLLSSLAADTSYGAEGVAQCTPTSEYPYTGEARARIAPLPNGGVLASGGDGDCSLVRYRPDGSLDPGFGAGGKVKAFVPLRGAPEDVAAGPGGTALVLRWQTGIGLRLARYTASGALDPSFGRRGRATVKVKATTFDQVNALVPLAKGRLLAVGTSQCGDWSCGEFALARYWADGSLDPTFGKGGLATTPFGREEGVATSAAIAPDGDIVVGGAVGVRAYSELHKTKLTLARYRPDGALDRRFGKRGIVTLPSLKGEDAQFNGVAIAPDRDIVAVGESSCTVDEKGCGKRYCPECGTYVVARFHPGGARDRAFGKDGVLHIDVGHNDEDHDAARAVAILPDGKILVAGRSYRGGFGIVRLLPDGRRDPSFGHRGIVHTFFSIVRRGQGGKTFETAVGRRGYALALLPGGKFLVAGGTVVPHYYPKASVPHPMNHGVIVRYRPDGGVDPSFGEDGVTEVPGLAIRAVTVDGCGRAIVAGAYNKESHVTSFGAARLTRSGALDARFDRRAFHLAIGTGLDSRANAVVVGGGKIVLGGPSNGSGAGDAFTLAALRGGVGCTH
jgi:uncharacterized delta-60 repeat protein